MPPAAVELSHGMGGALDPACRSNPPVNFSTELPNRHGVTTDRPAGAKRVAFAAIMVVLCLLLFEFGSFVAVGVLVRKGWMAYIPRFTEEQMAFYLRERDPALGWAFITDSTWGHATDSGGRITRPIPRPDPARFSVAVPCVSTYGDSFVYGTEEPDSASFPHYLGTLLGCPVRNFGVPGYGSDQAVMLSRAQAALDSAPLVIVQHLTENVLRNVNRYANLLYPGSPLRFKPRFVVSGDTILYLASPVSSRSGFARLAENPDSALAPEGFLNRPRAEFPFSVALLRWLAGDVKLRSRITQVPVEAPFYELDHPAGGFELSAAILTAAARDAAAHGKRAVVLLQTTRQGLIYAKEEGRWMDAALYDTLRARGLSVIHAGPLVLRALGNRDPCDLFDDCVQTHLSAEGNRIVAGIIAEYLKAEKLVP